jgi:catechol 2,3-dioxygenase-like lactoylglutathione lyase family enzyme
VSVTTSSGTTVTALRQVALTVSDVARSTAFYRDMVGLPFLFAAGPSLAFLAIGSVRLMLASPEGDFKPGLSSVLYFKVDDIIGAHAEMSARGVSFLTPPHLIAPMPDHDLWLCDFRDPDGHTMALMAERPKGSK